MGIYAPTDDKSVAVKDDFDNQMRDILDQIPIRCEVILDGDLNGRVGKRMDSKVVRNFGEDAIKNNGQRLMRTIQPKNNEYILRA